MTVVHGYNRLTEKNAGRSCAICHGDACGYLITDEESTMFICERHLQEVAQ
jgi:hypothetical protein